MTKKTVGRVQKTSTSENTNGEKFGILLEDEDGNENWYNGWGSVPEGVTEGAKVQIPYEINESNGSLYRNIEDKDAVDILEEGNSSSSSSSSGQSSKNYARQNAVKTVGSIFQGIGTPNARQLQAMKVLIEEFENYNEEGEFDNMNDMILQALNGEEAFGPEGISKEEETGQEEEGESKESSEASEEEVNEEDSSVEEEEATEEQEESEEESSEEELQEEMKEALEENAEGEDVIFGEEGEEGEEQDG